jgi:putative RNA 2'-phosphotransferase
MNTDRTTTQTSKKLSWLLRHGAREAGLPMDEAGWVAIADLLAHLRLDRARLDELVATNSKNRLQIDGPRIRCCQGHSNNSGVTAAALEASWVEHRDDALIWHGTTVEAVPAIAGEGLLPQARTHVHLAPTPASTVGKRAQVAVRAARGEIRHAASLGLSDEGGVAETRSTPGTTSFRLLALDENPGARRRVGFHHVLLGIDPTRVRAAGVTIYAAPNGVILARRIPAASIVELRAMTKRARAQEPALRRLLFAEAVASP